MNSRQQDYERLDTLLQVFTQRLFKGFEEAIQIVQETGIPNIGKPRYLAHPAGDWRKVMQLPIEDWRIVIVPLQGYAWPNINDEAMIPGSAFKEPCARLAFFLMQNEDPSALAFYDAIILLNASWFAWGYGWPKQQDDVESTNFTTLALDMLASFVKDVHVTWSIRSETTLTRAMDAKRRAYDFGLPGSNQ
jgi:hypothetical protein